MTATKVPEEPLNQGTADGSVPAATGQATTSGQAANEAGGNMFTQIKVKNMTCLEGKECSRSNLMVAYVNFKNLIKELDAFQAPPCRVRFRMVPFNVFYRTV
jgi:hypothetical protein